MSKVVNVIIALVIILVLGLIYIKIKNDREKFFSVFDYGAAGSGQKSVTKAACQEICDCRSTKKRRSKCKKKNCNKFQSTDKLQSWIDDRVKKQQKENMVLIANGSILI